MNIHRGLQRISAIFWGLVVVFGLFLTVGIAADYFKAGNMGTTAEVVLIGVAITLAVGYGGHKAVCWVVAGFADDSTRR